LAEMTGIVLNPRIDQEAGMVVLRCVIQCDSGERVPVEMRGREIRGVLESGDRVALSGKRFRDKQGIARPRELTNLSTNSTVRAYRPGVFRRVIGLLFSLVISVATGALTSLLVTLLTSPKRGTGGRIPRIGPSGSADSSGILILSVATGVVVGLVVFYFVYVRRRR
jgi:hypothetical protein